MRHSTNFLRFLAILLIINSHMDGIYPVKQLATGGAIGNSLFFMLSGFGLTLSAINRPLGFKDFVARRFTRIFPAVWVLVALFLFPIKIWQGVYQWPSVLEHVGALFYPPFWFIKAIFLFYIIFYFIINKCSHKAFIGVVAASVAAYFCLYFTTLDLTVWTVELIPFKIVFYFLVMLFGVYVARKKDSIRYRGVMDFGILFALVCVMYGHKLLMSRGLSLEYQFFQQAILFPILYYFYKISQSPFVESFMSNRVAGPLAVLLASMTLELYMAHFMLKGSFGWHFGFPFNFGAFISLSFILAWVVHYLAGKLVEVKSNL